MSRLQLGGELHEVVSSQQGAGAYCERINLAFEKAVAKCKDEAYAAGFKTGLERAAVITGRQTGWVAGTIQEDIREEIEKI